jgi:membrane protein DedA with SNARE-associated domain
VTAYVVLAATAFGGQSALVVPIVPLLASAGALAAHGELHVGLAIVALAAGIIPRDTGWYWLGRKRRAAAPSRGDAREAARRGPGRVAGA